MSKKLTSQYNCVLFDMDGVLINSIELWLKVGIEGLQELKITATREDMVKGIVKFQSLAKIGVQDLSTYGKRINVMFSERINEVELHENIVNVLKELKKRKIKMGVVTTSGKVAVKGLMGALKIESYFDAIVTYDDVEKHKPDPEGLYKALKTLNALPQNTIMVGDTRNDILAGKAAGTETVLYYPACHEEIYDKDYLLGLCADYYIRDLRAILEIV